MSIAYAAGVDWRAAACRASDRDFFGGHRASDALAKRVCAGCPIRRECLEDQLAYERAHWANHRYGVFGGVSGPERAKILQAERTCAV